MRTRTWLGAALVLSSVASSVSACHAPSVGQAHGGPQPFATFVPQQYALAGEKTLPPDGGHTNGLPGSTLMDLARHQEVLDRLKGAALTTSTFSEASPLSDYVVSPTGKQVMSYLVSCALDPETTIGEWSGELGLCGKSSAAGNWGAAPPTPQCLELVSSCLLARVNGVGRRVLLSMRGPSQALFPMRSRVRVQDRRPEKEGKTQIKSFVPCKAEQGGEHPRNCGWKSLYVGTCHPRAGAVVVGAGGGKGYGSFHPVGMGGERAILRVCEGIYGCNRPSLGEARYNFLNESGPMAWGEAGPAVSFECPESGYFGVMITPRGSLTDEDAEALRFVAAEGFALQVRAEQSHEGDARYPATEAEVFRYREGAFYGDVFNGVVTLVNASTPLLPVAEPLPRYRTMYACHDAGWTSGEALLLHRVCADKMGLDRDCLSMPPGTCWTPPLGALKDRCGPPFLTPGGAYLPGCQPPTSMSPSEAEYAPHVWKWPITVYLNGPCDLRDDASCRPTSTLPP